jgi:PAT family acetyl-CoA transporter-like MFS transporter 1
MTTKTVPLLIIFLLIILYILQGVIIGFISTIPLYLDSRGAKWKEQGTFNFVFYPFSLKLAWAPIIDALYISRFGRRKTWLIPIQYLIGITLFILSFYLTKLIEELKIKILTCIFFFIYFLLASQDISVDGWALTLLTDYNLQWASTCQTVGQTTGRFIGFTILMTFESANFTNRFIRKPFSITEKSYGLLTIDQFIRFWAIVFLLISSWIGLLIKEKEENNHLNLKQTYLSIFQLFKKKCIRQLAFLFLISPIGYAATYSMTILVLKK